MIEHLDRSEADYLRRKALEAAVWEAQDRAAPKPSWETLDVESIIKLKAQVAREHFARAAAHPDLGSETRFGGRGAVERGAYHLDWGYQRFDLSASGPTGHEAALFALPLKFNAASVFTASGMAAIAASVLALNAVAQTPLQVLCSSDAYFETQRLIEETCCHLNLARISPNGPGAPASAGDCVVLVDSIGVSSHDFILEQTDPGRLRAVLFDTTCYGACSEAVARVAAFALQRRVPLLLLRSHIKLDQLGVEYSRLGSLTFVSPRDLPSARLDWLQQWQQQTQRLLSVTGRPYAPAFCPELVTPQAQELNEARVAKIRTANWWLAAELKQHNIPVRSHHHGLFNLIPLPPKSGELADVTNQAAACLRRAGVPAVAGGTFGRDVFTVDSYMDLCSRERPHPRHIRLSCSDYPPSLLHRCAEALVNWYGQARSTLSVPILAPPA